MIVDNCPVCNPIENLLNELREEKCVVVQEKVSDYHFYELYFKVKCPGKMDLNLTIENIRKVSDHIYTCECHWSIVEMI